MAYTASQEQELLRLLNEENAKTQSSDGGFDLSTAKPVDEGFDLSTAHPVAQAPTNSPFPTMGDVLSSGANYLGNTAQAILHPIKTVQGIGNLALGGAEKLIPGTQPQEPYADALGNFIQQRYGSFDAAKNTFKHDPVGMLADASMFLTGGGGAVAKVGELNTIPKLVSAGRFASRVGQAIDPLTATLRAARIAGTVPARAMESGLTSAAGQIINSLIKPTNRQFSYGRDPGLAVAKEGIVASSLEDLAAKTSARVDELGQKIGVVLNDPLISSKRLNLTKMLEPINAAITKAQQAPRTNANIIQRLENLRNDLLGVVVNPDGTTTVTRNLTAMAPAEAFNLKKTIGELTQWTDNFTEDGVVNGALKQAYGKVRSSIEGVAPGIRFLNERYADLLEATTAASRQALVAQRRNQFGLQDVILGIEGGTHEGLGGATVGILLSQGAKMAMRSPYVRTQLANWMLHATPTEIESFFNRIPGLRSEAMRVGLLTGTGQQRITNRENQTRPTGQNQ